MCGIGRKEPSVLILPQPACYGLFVDPLSGSSEQPLCGGLCNKAWSLDLEIVAVPYCWSLLFGFRRLCLPGKRKFHLLPLRPIHMWYNVDKVIKPNSIYLHFLCNTSSIAMIVSALRSGKVTRHMFGCIWGHVRKQQCFCVCLFVQCWSQAFPVTWWLESVQFVWAVSHGRSYCSCVIKVHPSAHFVNQLLPFPLKINLWYFENISVFNTIISITWGKNTY